LSQNEVGSVDKPLPAVEGRPACFVVRDHNGQQLAYVYFEEEPRCLTLGERLRHAYNVGTGAIMWNEREMPARWYELLRERMQVERLRMRIVKHGYLIEDDQLQELLTEAHSFDAEMLLVMRQTIAEALAREEVLRP
jgi:hypothetical protein